MQQPFTPADDLNREVGCGSTFGFASLDAFPSLEDKAANMANVACGLADKACDADAANDHGLSKQLSDLSKRFIARSNSYLDDADAERVADEKNAAADSTVCQCKCAPNAAVGCESPRGTDVIYFHRTDVIAEPEPGDIDLFSALRHRLDLAHRITDVRFFVTDGLTTTVCLLTLDDDLSVVGVGSLVKSEEYNRTDGMFYAFGDAVSKLLDAEGYANKRTILSNTR